MGKVDTKKSNLAETVSRIKYFIGEVWGKKLWIILCSIILASILLVQAYFTPKTYPAVFTFMVNDDEGNGLSGMGAVLGELGFGGKKSSHNFEKISEISLSRKILSTVLEQKLLFKGKEDFCGNHLIDLYQFEKEWKEDTILGGFRYSDDTLQDRSLRQREVADERLARFLRGNPSQGIPGVFSFKYNEESTILAIIASTRSEELSIRMANLQYEKLSDFYIEKSIERQRNTYEHVRSKADSLKIEVELTEARLANFRDRGHGIVLKSQSLPKQQLQRKVEMLYLMYSEAIKNLETAEFLLKNSTPYFQSIDRPVGPIQPRGRSKKIALLKGVFLGGFLALLFIVSRRLFLDEMNSPSINP